MYQLCYRNEYGETHIIASNAEIVKLVEKAKEEVNEINTNNSLTFSEQNKNWEAYTVEIVDEDNTNIDEWVYSGINSRGKHILLSPRDEEIEINQSTISDIISLDCSFRFYLGNKVSGSKVIEDWYESWYASDEFGKKIQDLHNNLFKEKVVYFIRKVK